MLPPELYAELRQSHRENDYEVMRASSGEEDQVKALSKKA
jgi:hypothetical protein